jgi:hypothetical protein
VTPVLHAEATGGMTVQCAGAGVRLHLAGDYGLHQYVAFTMNT